MANYHVIWEIDLEAESFVDAARLALEVQRDPSSTATLFSVRNKTTGDGEFVDASSEEQSEKE